MLKYHAFFSRWHFWCRIWTTALILRVGGARKKYEKTFLSFGTLFFCESQFICVQRKWFGSRGIPFSSVFDQSPWSFIDLEWHIASSLCHFTLKTSCPTSVSEFRIFSPFLSPWLYCNAILFKLLINIPGSICTYVHISCSTQLKYRILIVCKDVLVFS